MDQTLTTALAEFGAVSAFGAVLAVLLMRVLKEHKEERSQMRDEMRDDRKAQLDAINRLNETLTTIRVLIGDRRNNEP